MRRRFVLALAAVLLAACGSSPVAVAPPAVPTRVPLRAVDLESVLIQAGDLPAGVTADGSAALPKIFADITTAERWWFRPFRQDNKPIGWVAAFLYEQPSDRTRAYRFIADGMGETKPIGNVGDEAIYASFAMPQSATDTVAGKKPVFTDLLFQRCAAVVHVRWSSATSEDDAKTYAKQLDSRLQGIVC